MRALLDLVYPRSCPGCGRADVAVCAACVGELRPGVRAAARAVPEVRYCAGYSGWMRDVLIEYKNGAEHRVHALAAVLRSALPPPAALVVAVPSTPGKLAQRGFDTIGELVQAAGASALPALRVNRAVADQVGLSGAQRRANLHGALTATMLVHGTVWVIDDVVTTGATVAEASRALRAAGADRVVAVALCAGRG